MVGKAEGILSDTKQEIPYIGQNWWIKLQRFLKHIMGNIYMEEDYTIQPLKPHNWEIMDQIRQEKHWTTNQLEMINACWLYLQVTYISEIADSTTKLEKCIQQSRTKEIWSRSKLKWPVQPDPGKQAWKLWSKALRTLVGEDGATLKKAQHKDWLDNAGKHCEWKFMYNDVEKCIYEDNGRWYKLETTLWKKLILKQQEQKYPGESTHKSYTSASKMIWKLPDHRQHGRDPVEITKAETTGKRTSNI